MRGSFAVRSFFLVVGFFAVLSTVLPAIADESEVWSKMLRGLKTERKYYDTALEYLEWMKNSPLATPALKKQFDYQVAEVHLDAMENNAMFLPRPEHMKKCQEALERYLKDNPNGEFAFDAISTQGRLLMEDGRNDLFRAEQDTTKESDRGPLREKARKSFEKAMPVFEKADAMATEQAKKIKAAKAANPSAVSDSDLYGTYGRFLAGKILINLTKADIAKTYPKESKEFKEKMKGVAEAFAGLGKTYNEYSAGMDAKLYAAKAYKDLGDFKQARGILGELNVLQGDDYMGIKTESLLMALEMNLAEKKPENYADSVSRARGWNDSASAVNKRSKDGQQIYLLGAKNFIAYAETIKDKKQDSDKAIRDANAFLRQIRPDSQYAKEAQEILRQIGGAKTDKGDPQSFAEAKEFADDDWKDFVIAFNTMQEAKTADQKKKAKDELDKVGQTCLLSFNRAINMREEGTPISEVNAIRGNLYRVYWFQGKSLEAAILADYLAQRYSGEPDADKSAETAIKLYRQVFVEDKRAGHDASGIANRLLRLSDFIMKRWEGKEVAGTVQLIQIETAIDNGNLDEAKALLAKTQEGTPQRVSAELRIGQSLWNNYAAAMRLPEDSEDRPEKKKLAVMLAEAKQQLERGLNNKIKLIESGTVKVDAPSVISAMLLAQICMTANDNKGAIDWVSNKFVGPLTLMDNPPGGVSLEELRLDDNLKLSCTMLALRAYVGTENLDMAEKTMDKLEGLIKQQTATGEASTPEEKQKAEQKLTQIYVSLGRQLENRLKELSDAGEFDQADKVAKGFELFLTRIKNRGEANSFQSLYWVADTFYRLGSGLTAEGKPVPPAAADYFKKAAATYVDIKKRLVDQPDWAPEKAEKTIDVRLAESLRSIGIYDKAMKFLADILQENENRLDTQIEAAKTLEAWGKKEPKKYYSAVGGRDPGKYIWGWNGLGNRLATSMANAPESAVEQFTELYYDAQLSKLRCFVEIYKTEPDKAKKEKAHSAAMTGLTQLVSQRANLGGPEMFAKFDQLYKNLQKADGIAKPQTLKDLQKDADSVLLEAKAADEKRAAEQKQAAEAEAAKTEADKEAEVAQKAKEAEDAATAANMNMIYAVGGTALLCLPFVFFLVFRKKKPVVKSAVVDKISIPIGAGPAKSGQSLVMEKPAPAAKTAPADKTTPSKK